MKRQLTKALAVILATVLLSAFTGCDAHLHKYSDATCIAPEQCECGESRGDALGHNYAAATCTTPQKCTRCGKLNGKALGHQYADAASCTEPQICTRCKQASGSVMGHSYRNATCTTPQTCDRCGAVSGTALGHSYSNATCTSPQMCTRCDESTGSPLGHDFSEATCNTPETCKRCGDTNGGALGHKYADDTCIRCGAVDPDSLPTRLEDLTVISSAYYEYSANPFTSTYGDTYSGAHKYVAGGGYSGNDGYSAHNLRGEYSTFSGIVVAGDSMYHGTTVTLDIYVDDVLVHSIPDYTRETGPVEFTISVKNANKLKIAFDKSYDNLCIAIVNAQLEK